MRGQRFAVVSLIALLIGWIDAGIARQSAPPPTAAARPGALPELDLVRFTVPNGLRRRPARGSMRRRSSPSTSPVQRRQRLSDHRIAQTREPACWRIRERLEDHAVRHSWHHLARIRTALNH